MSDVPAELRYTESHEWARIEGDEVVVGITAFAVESLQDLVFIELPETGAAVKRGTPFGEIESVKAVSELNAPLDGTITGVNDAVADDLDALTRAPYGEGWMIRVKPDGDPAAALEGLMDAEAYKKHTEESGH
jgi:glycine cleavage system H protein